MLSSCLSLSQYSQCVEKVFTMKSILQQLDPDLLTRARKLSVLTLILQEETPPQSHPHFQVVNINRHSLFVVTDSALWATKLRQLAPNLVNALLKRRDSPAYKIDLKTIIPENIKHIQIVTRPEIANSGSWQKTEKTTRKRHLTPEVAAKLSQSASAISDERLKKALLKLSSLSRQT